MQFSNVMEPGIENSHHIIISDGYLHYGIWGGDILLAIYIYM